MKHSSSHFNFIALLSVTLILLAGAPLAHAQSDIPRETVAITYPLDQAVTVRFRGTTRLPRLSGEAKVKRTGRRNTHVELSVHNLPRANELGGVYTTYVLWAISPEGHADNLGEIKRSGSQFIDSKLDVTTPLQTFALIVTAEPYFAVKQPSAMIVLQNAFHRSDDPNVVQADLLQLRSDPKTPLDIFEARNAVRIARLAGAERYAAEPFHKALQLLQQAEGIFAHKDHDLPDVKEKAREATEAAEDARAVATERGQESHPMPPADAQGAFANTQ